MFAERKAELEQTVFLQAPRPWWQEIILVCTLLFPSFYFGNEYIGLLLPLFLLWFNFDFWKKAWTSFRAKPFSKDALKFVWAPLLFIVLALANKILNGDPIRCNKDYYAAFLLLPFLLIAARTTFSVRTFRVFIVFILLETVVGLIEYSMNQRSLFLPVSRETTIISKALLYDSRVFGFTVNSSLFALHLMVALFFLVPARLKRVWYWVVFVVLMIGLLLSFNRAVVLVAVLFFAVQFLQFVWLKRKQLKGLIRVPRIQDALVSAIFLVVLVLHPWVKESFARGGKTEQLEYNLGDFSWDTIPLTCSEEHARIMLEPSQLDTTKLLARNFLAFSKRFNTSGRKLIWMNYITAIEEHPLAGNGSNKLMLRTLNPKTRKVELIHAHNSYLELFGTYGLPLGLFFLLLLILWWRRKNFPIILSILAYSFLQYGVFWGFSLLDVVFLFVLFSSENLIESEYQEANS